MSETPKKKASILVRGFVFLMLSGVIAQLGVYFVVFLGVVASALFVAHRIGKLPPVGGLPRVTKYVALAALLAIPTANIRRQMAVDQANNDKVSAEALTAAKDLLSQKRYSDAVVRLQAVTQLKTDKATEAKALLDYARNFTSTEQLKKTVMSLQKDQFEKILAGQTISLNPDPTLNRELIAEIKSKGGQFKAVFYSVKAEEEKEKIEEGKLKKKHDRRIASFGKAPEASAWDGGYREVKRFLEKAANDPDSIKIEGCTKVQVDDSAGWIVGCDYRGKNAFGGVVKNSNWFVIRNGAVVKVLPANAYK